jgi:hypothetical protein
MQSVVERSRRVRGRAGLRCSVLVVLCFAALSAVAQEGDLQSDFRRERKHIREACDTFGLKLVTGCAYTLFTDHPLHIAAGSMPPQNGFGLGGAFVAFKNTTNWRMSWDVDAMGATSGSWRAGAYMKMIHTPEIPTGSILGAPDNSGGPPAKKSAKVGVHPYTVFNLYAQTTSLNKLNFFGLGNNTTLAGASVFGMSQTILGANVTKPVFELPSIKKLNLALLGEVNGRFVDIRGEHGQSTPSIETVYTNVTAPGLNSQPGFIQLGEGVRIAPTIPLPFEPLIRDLELNYTGKFQQFFAPSSSTNSFLRWTVDLDHTFNLYGVTQSTPLHADTRGPDECAPQKEDCPPPPTSFNLNGSIGIRLLLSESINSATSAAPFYFQQTLGGQDIDSALTLGSYQDYRFRAPNLLLLQENFEHSIWGPFGLKFMADQGRVALTRGDLGFSHLKHSFAGGLTLRAGGFPMISMMFAWGAEGHHNLFNMNTSLLGGSTRPLLD